MTITTEALNVLQRCTVAPATDAADLRLPLTSYDMIWIFFHPIERLLFYKHPCSAADFKDNVVPHLKNSLSQTLREYLPLAGNLHRPLDSSMPELCYLAGDSVAVTFAESSGGADFDYLTGNQARDADAFHCFVPELPGSKIDSENGVEKFPLLAIQVTVFPGTGIVIGITNHHVAGDASSIIGFLKAWSLTAKLGFLDDTNITLPFYDRSGIEDPTGRADIYWNQMRGIKLPAVEPHTITNKVRSTFILQKSDLEKLKNLVKEKQPDLTHLSSFTMTVAYFWWCIDRAAAESGDDINDDDGEFFGFAVDARGRVEPPLPAAYFGNCLGLVVAESTHGEIRGSEGFFKAARLVGELIRDKVNKKGMLFSDADEWMVKYAPLMGMRGFGVAGSPRFDVYGADFGWGTPVKFEAVSLDWDASISISLCKSREYEGGLEMGISLPKTTMDAFAPLFSHGFNILS